MRRTASATDAVPMKTLIAAALLLAIAPATASAGTIAGKLPRKGKR